jgi:hypothetical protein
MYFYYFFYILVCCNMFGNLASNGIWIFKDEDHQLIKEGLNDYEAFYNKSNSNH